MSRSHLIILSVALASSLLMLVSTAAAQIDHRVNTGNAGTAGRANDANPQVGSGGINAPVSRFDSGGYSNAIITGNVTGLGRFQGYSPIQQANAFRGSLQSTSLSSFQSISTGIDDVTSNRVLAPTRYYDTQRTISDVGFIRSGLNMPGSSQLVSPYVMVPSPTAPPPMAGVRQMPEATDLRVDQQANRNAWGMVQQQPVAPPTKAPIGRPPSDWPYRSAAGSSIFGVPPSNAIDDLLTRDSLARPALPAGEELEPGSESEAVNPATGAADGGLRPPPKPGDNAAEAAPFGVRNIKATGEVVEGPSGPGPTGAERVGRAAAAGPGNLGEDKFTDLLRAVQKAQQMGVKRLGFEAVPREGAESAALQPANAPAAAVGKETDKTPPPRRSLLRHPPSSGLAELATAAEWANDLLQNPMTSFASRYQSQVNQYLETGEAALRKGEYYRAADLFDLAHTVDPTNPLPLLHRGHALLAAGDYVSASACLQQGIARFPQIAAFRIDLPALGGSVYDVRRADLEKKLAKADQYELRFLLGYLELYSGLAEEGIQDLEKAAKSAPPDSVISLFADLVTNRREMPPLTQPQRGSRPSSE